MSWHKRFTAFLILLLLISTFVAVPHHHDDTLDDHDCPICVVSNHQCAASQSTVAFDAVPLITETSYSTPAQEITERIFISLLANRAPPA